MELKLANDLEIITQIEKRLGQELEKVDLNHIRGREHGYAIDKNENVIGLNLSLMQLADISFLEKLPNLVELRLYQIQISNIPVLDELTNLNVLNLGRNQISDISGLTKLRNLKQLHLHSNQISDVSSLKELTNLNVLILRNNQISVISSIKSLSGLTMLDLRHNKLSELPREILDLDMEIKWEDDGSGKGIFLDGNPLESPPVEIAKKGTEAVKAYFDSLEGEKKALNEVKLLLVGDGGVGKTSLMKRLLNEPFNAKEPQTHGININHWRIKHHTGKDNIKVNIWDFGGQEVMHATHQFFLSKRSLYVLVLDGRKDEKVEYWLKHVKSFGGDSPVLIAINKIDQNPAFDVNRLFLQEKYPNIKGFFRLSCADSTGIRAFSQHLEKELALVQLTHTTWAQSWFNVKIQLETMEKDFISYEEYKAICKKENINDKEAQGTLVDFLNDLGIVLHFKDFKLKETHVLNPEWVTTAVYKIINSNKVAAANGLLQLRHLDEILEKKESDDYYYPADKYKYIVELMQKFELCYEVDGETILIPDLLVVGEPRFEFDRDTALKFQVAYDFLPRSVLPRFIVKMHNDVKDQLHWRTGVVLEDKNFGCTALIKSDNEEKKIHIYVQGEQKRDYFSILRKTLMDINNSFEKLGYTERVPLPEEPGIAVEYRHLLQLQAKKIKTFIPEGSETLYDVKELIGSTYLEKESKKESKKDIFAPARKSKIRKGRKEPIEKQFNTTGRIDQDSHYYIEPLKRVDLEEILKLIKDKKYFVLHAPRQTGKTTLLFTLMDYLNKEGTYKCLYINVEMAQAARGEVEKGMRTILDTLAGDALHYLGDSFFKDKWNEIYKEGGEYSVFQKALESWCNHNSKHIVLLIDEVDSLVGDTLISLLRQLRKGYEMRPDSFPRSIVLCGVRDVRDYRIHSETKNEIITGGSAFNIKAKSLRLGNFNPGEIEMLYRQHTKKTGQTFNNDIFPLVWELTEGQPWLVNALAYETCFEMKEGRDRGREITVDLIIRARENIIARRETHLDQLADKLRENRVRRVIEPILSGSMEAEKIPVDDVNYVADLGLIGKDPHIKIANRIYQEIIPRELTYSTQVTINQETRWYVNDDGRLDMNKLLATFQGFFRKHFESWEDGFDYREAGPQLLLQAFLQRVVNSGGRVEREYGLGRQRTDLLVIWPYKKGLQEVVLELKLRYGDLKKTIQKGLEQTRGYMDKCGTSEGYLLVFDRNKNRTWEEKIFKQERTFGGIKIPIYGM